MLSTSHRPIDVVDPRQVTPPIDAVFTWVDGGDPQWRANFTEWTTRHRDETGPDGRHPARYRDNGELRFALRSIRRYAPWFRRIHVVTAGQTPAWLRPSDRLRLIAHDDIFEPSMLPTFNSHAIESRLHHISGLAERFVYFNDDVFLARPQRPDQWFDAAGRPLITLSDEPVPSRATSTGAAIDLSALATVRLLHDDRLLLSDRRPSHGPFALRRSHLRRLAARFPVELAATAHSRFRAPSDVSLPTFLAPMHGLATGTAAVGDVTIGYVGVDDVDLLDQLERFGGDGLDAFCLNDTERVPADDSRLRRSVERFLDARFPAPAPWERPVPTTALRFAAQAAGY